MNNNRRTEKGQQRTVQSSEIKDIEIKDIEKDPLVGRARMSYLRWLGSHVSEFQEERNGKRSVTTGKPKNRKGMSYRVSFEDISKGNNGFVNAFTKSGEKAKSGIEASLSTHKAFEHKRFGEILPVFIPQKIRSSKKLDNSEIGDWIKENVVGWGKGIWFSRIGSANIISDRPLDGNKHVTGRVLISSKKVEQYTRKGMKTYYFPHIILLGTEEKVVPVFTLVLNNSKGEDIPGEIHIGPTKGFLQDNKEVEQYLHLRPYK